MRNASFRLGLPICLLTLCGIIGCGGSTTAKKPVDEAAKQPQKVVGVSLWKTDDPWRAQMAKDVATGLERHSNIRVVLKDAQDNLERQIADVRQFLADRVQLIIISPKDSQALAEPVADAFRAGIPVVVVDRALIGDKYTCLIQANNKQIGAAIAQWLAEQLKEKGKLIVIRGPVDSIPNRERYEAFRNGMLDPKFRFVFEGHVDPPKVGADKVMQEALAGGREADAVVAYDDEAAAAAYATAKAAGVEKKMLFVGVGGLPDVGQKFVREGMETASFLRPTGGAEAVDVAMKLLAGKPIPKTLSLNTRVFTKDNVESGGQAVAIEQQ